MIRRSINRILVANPQDDLSSSWELFESILTVDPSLCRLLTPEFLVIRENSGRSLLHFIISENKISMNPDFTTNLLIQGNIDDRDYMGLTPIHLACQSGSPSTVNRLIELSADLNAQNYDGETPLHLAIRSSRPDIVDILLKAAAVTTIRDNNGSSPLVEAIAFNDGIMDVFRTAAANRTVRDHNGMTLLHAAAMSNHPHIVKFLLEAGADIMAKETNGMTSLHVATRFDAIEIAGMLIGAGADVKAKDKSGMTPLHVATQSDAIQIAGMLIGAGADIMAKDRSGMTPWISAAQNSPQILSAILANSQNINVSARDDRGWTALHHAAVHSNVLAAVILIYSGVDILAQNPDGNTAYDIAMQCDAAPLGNHQEIVDILSNYNDLSIQPTHEHTLDEVERCNSSIFNEGWSLLHFAAKFNQPHSVVRILQAVQDVVSTISAKNQDGRTAKGVASHRGNSLVMRILDDHMLVNHGGWNALHFAARYNDIAAASTLISLGVLNGLEKTIAGKNALDIAQMCGSADIMLNLAGLAGARGRRHSRG